MVWTILLICNWKKWWNWCLIIICFTNFRFTVFFVPANATQYQQAYIKIHYTVHWRHQWMQIWAYKWSTDHLSHHCRSTLSTLSRTMVGLTSEYWMRVNMLWITKNGYLGLIIFLFMRITSENLAHNLNLIFFPNILKGLVNKWRLNLKRSIHTFSIVINYITHSLHWGSFLIVFVFFRHRPKGALSLRAARCRITHNTRICIDALFLRAAPRGAACKMKRLLSF